MQSVNSLTVDDLASHPEFIDLSSFAGLQIDLKYASTDNFLNENVYGNFKVCYLHRLAADKLQKAVALLREQNPHCHFLVYDALRPRAAQQKLWDKVKDTPWQIYVADPAKGSIHNFGMAIDLTVADHNGPLDMGAGFDEFHERSEPRREQELLQAGLLTPQQIANREILRRPLLASGFSGIEHEWWHFNAIRSEEKWNYPIVE